MRSDWNNIPDVKIGIVAVSRGCFSRSLAENRLHAVVQAYTAKYGDIYPASVIVESETDMRQALCEIQKADCQALVVYLGNFGPETAETLLAKEFGGPVMMVGAAEEPGNDMHGNRGDAYCGMLNASYNLSLRNAKAYIPEKPVGVPSEIAARIAEFRPIANAVYGVRNLKLISFGPRPQDFLACNAPIKRLYDLGVEIEENSELDLLDAYEQHHNDPRIPAVVQDMASELGCGNLRQDALPRLAQYELTLLDWAEEHKGAKKYVAFAAKCWPTFEKYFHFVPCYVNGRMADKGMPVSCEVDIYGALSEYIGTVVSRDTVTILDVNNTVPQDLYENEINSRYSYRMDETFMGFHCGNTAACKLASCRMGYVANMAKTLPEEMVQETIEGDLAPGPVTLFRLQSTADAVLKAYVAQGEVLPVATGSFGSIGVIAIPEMDRFYRHVLIENNFPHHAAVAFSHCGRPLFEVLKYLGVAPDRIGYNQPDHVRYASENPFEA